MARTDGSLIFDTSIDRKGFEKGLIELKNISKTALKAMTTAIMGTVAAVGAIGTASTKVGMEFEKSMSRVGALSGATGKELKELEKVALDLGKNTSFSASQAAEGMQYLAMAGYSVNDTISAMPGLLSVAAAGQLELGAAADITSNILSGFGIAAENTTQVADILTLAFTSSNTSLESLGETMKYVAPMASAAGFSLEETAAAAGLLGNAGIQGGQAGTMLRAVMSRLINPVGAAKDALDRLGVSAVDSSGQIKPLSQIVTELEDATEGMTDAQKTAIISQIAGQEAASGLLAIMSAGGDTLAEFTKELENAGGTAQRVADEQLNNLAGDVELLKSALEGAGITIYKQFDEPLRAATQAATGYIGQIEQAVSEGGFEALASVVGDILADVLQKITEFAPRIIEMAASLIQSFIGGIKENLPSIVESALEIGRTLIDTVLTLLPEVLELGMELLISLMLGIADMIPDLTTQIIDTVILIADMIIDNLPLLIDAGIQIIFAIVEGLIKNLPRLIEEVPRIINAFSDAIIEQLPMILLMGMKLIWEIIKGLIQAIPTLIMNIPQIIMAIVNVFSLYNFAQIGKTAITKIGQGISSMVGNIGTTARNLGNNVIKAFKNILSGSSVAEIGKNLVKGIWNGISNVTGWILDKIKGFGSSILKGIKGIFGIKSPSKIMRDQIGKNLTLGIGVGLEDGMPKLEKDVDKEMTKLTKKMKASVDIEANDIGQKVTASSTIIQKVIKISDGGNDSNDINEIVITGNTFVVREEADIKKIAIELDKLKQSKLRGKGKVVVA